MFCIHCLLCVRSFITHGIMSALHMEKSDSFESIPDVGLFQSMTLDDVTKASDDSKNNDKENMTVFKMKEMKGEFKAEPLLVEDKSRFVLFPIKYTDVSSPPFSSDLAYLILLSQ